MGMRKAVFLQEASAEHHQQWHLMIMLQVMGAFAAVTTIGLVSCILVAGWPTSRQLEYKLATTSASFYTSEKKVRILVGVLTTAAKLERRSLLRMAYGVQSCGEFAEVSVRFVLGKPKNEQERGLVDVEMLHHKDLMVLDCEENLNAGKTYAYFLSVAGSGEQFDYVMKTDDDSYVRLANLAESLRNLSRTDLYYGYILPCENTNPYVEYMAGMGYLLSWDLVEWIGSSPIPRNNSVGTEDKLVGDWLNAGNKAKFRIDNKPRFYDHPEFGGGCAHELTQNTILIHQLKTLARWVHVLSYFEGRTNLPK